MIGPQDNWKKPPDKFLFDPIEINKSVQIKYRPSLMDKMPIFSELPPKLRAVYVCKKIRMTWPEIETAMNTPRNTLRRWYREAKIILEGVK